MNELLCEAGKRLAALLQQHNTRIVFAESCTAGLASATLAQSPGVSQWHCGSAVTYREATKTAWLEIPPSEIEAHNLVSAEIAQRMALGVLRITPEADIAAAITGHLGPHAPAELDGVTFIAIAQRQGDEIAIVTTKKHPLKPTSRSERQQEAAARLLQVVCETLRDTP